MLAASTVAVVSDDLATARARSAAALSFAEASGDAECLSWASWQQAGTVLLAGDTDAALVGFRRAADKGGPEPSAGPVRVTGELSREVLALRRGQEEHRAAQAALRRREHEALERLHGLVTADAGRAALAGGWSAAPVPVRLRGATGGVRGAAGSGDLAGRDEGAAVAPDGGTRAGGGGVGGGGAGGDRLRRLWPVRRPATTTPGPVTAPADAAGLTVIVQLMGPFRVAVRDVPLPGELTGRIRSLFAYLVTHRDPWPARDVLIEALWPGAPPEAGRNNLNVALHALRRALRQISPDPVVVFIAQGYRLHPAVRLWLDVDTFDERIAAARRQVSDGSAERAIAGFEEALGLHRGEFLAADPYEQWAGSLRERLRVTHVDVLSSLAHLYFDASGYARAGELCRHLLELDPCREEAHRLLMRCSVRQGLPHLALLQFRTCVRVLRQELRAEPAPETVDLYRRVHRHEPI